MTRGLSQWMLRAIGLLVFILILDSTIALDFVLNQGANAATLISYGTIPLIVALFVIVLTMPRFIEPGVQETASSALSETQDAEIEQDLRAILESEQLFLDPDITVQRLARRLHVPVRVLSGAVNRTQSMNVSQYVNTFRLAHAAQLLVAQKDSVTKIATQSGFMSRSNFYREFQRVHGQSPTEYRDTQRANDRAETSN